MDMVTATRDGEYRPAPPWRQGGRMMLALLIVLLLLILLFGGLGVFIAKTFLWVLLLVILVGLIASFFGRGRFGGRA
jgi:hypothetical protein